MMKMLKFTVPVPTSSKNSRQLYVTKSGRPGSQPSTKAKTAKQIIQGAALAKLSDITAETLVPMGISAFGPDVDIAVGIKHDVRAGLVHVEIWACGPKPADPTGRGRDVDNFASTILDALNGIAYGDDRQVALLQVERIYE